MCEYECVCDNVDKKVKITYHPNVGGGGGGSGSD